MANWQIASDIAERVLELRTATGMTQEELGKLAGVNGRQIYSWEKGHAVPPRGRLVRLCERQDWPIDMFAEGGPRPKTCVNGPRSPSNERTRREGYQTVYVNAITEVGVHMAAGTLMSPQRVMYWLNALLAAFKPPIEEAGGPERVRSNGDR